MWWRYLRRRQAADRASAAASDHRSPTTGRRRSCPRLRWSLTDLQALGVRHQPREVVLPAADVLVVLLLEHGDLPAHLTETALGHLEQRPAAGRGEVERDEQRVALCGRLLGGVCPPEREGLRRSHV